MASIFDWSSTESSNVTIGGYNTNTGMTPANVDNVFRAIASIVRQTFSSALQAFLGGTAALPVANGGTGATDAATALSNLGGLADDYRDIPIIVKSGAFTFADNERASGILYNGAAAAATINPSATTPITRGAAYPINNVGSGALTITRGAGVNLRKNGETTSSDAVIALGGAATLVNWDTDYWVITGVGVS